MNAHDPVAVQSIEHAQPVEEGLVREFVLRNPDYYIDVFARIRRASGAVWPFNLAAALLGPVWAAARGITLLFWLIFFLETLAVVQIGVGAAGNLGAGEQARAERVTKQAQVRAEQAKAAEAAGADNAAGLKSSAAALEKAANTARMRADAAKAKAPVVIGSGIVTLLFARLIAGFLANRMLERRFARWRSNPTLQRGLNHPLALCALAFCIAAYGLSVYRFAAPTPAVWLTAAPSNREWQAALSSGLDSLMGAVSHLGEGFFGGITGAISLVLDALAYGLTGMPWPVTMAIILALAWQLAGPRVAIFTAAALAYLAVLGFWEKSLETVALLGTSAIICLAIGIPLGIWCGRRPRVYAAVRPVLDFMQTMPAFVYLIPVIALFGIGKPPGVIATLIFGTPPVVRLTALGLQGVPPAIREAAQAYGATRWFLLTRVDLPLAMPSIMAGINQTILMCLSMVVIASLIGAKGLGEDVLNALQYAAVGQGLLAGFAILLCAMIIDRIVQGRTR
ncbi:MULTISPECIES: ABC transporter permease subunit [unclassified Mesorhizobium]|uniref:ABC transporter permease n=1 Tax=unclassified Mesorhizobium TaxID=325217 RepID=UPI001AEE4361|nr:MULTISPECIES: ABC transporter permease subunit [unclassified Mesorhizobium]MBZ9984996.1 ABC transporter permease subunit [Mesorhizobium sp. BR-1-1-8]MCA0025697.1 ABC transporter permease subunit [Mesorhizobium sp. B263B1A]